MNNHPSDKFSFIYRNWKSWLPESLKSTLKRPWKLLKNSITKGRFLQICFTENEYFAYFIPYEVCEFCIVGKNNKILLLKLFARFISYPRTETNMFPNSLDLRPLVENQTVDPNWGGKTNQNKYNCYHNNNYYCWLSTLLWIFFLGSLVLHYNLTLQSTVMLKPKLFSIWDSCSFIYLPGKKKKNKTILNTLHKIEAKTFFFSWQGSSKETITSLSADWGQLYLG